MTQTRKKLVFSWVLILLMVISVIAPGSTFVVKAEEAGYKAKLTAVTKCLHDNVEPVYGNEWALIQQARATNPDKKWLHNYYYSLVDQLSDDNKVAKMKTGDWARVILAVEALGEDPENFNGKNLFKNLADFSQIDKSGWGMATMAYILMGVGNRDDNVFGADETIENPTTKEKLKKAIIDLYNTEKKCFNTNDWYTYELVPDSDNSAYAIQALAAYYGENDVKTIIDDTLNTLSSDEFYDENAGIKSFGYANACSTAQVICACLAVDKDELDRFTKNKKTIIDVLCEYFDSETGGIISYGSLDLAYNTVQAGYALVAYDRSINAESFVFNIDDVSSEIYKCKGEHTYGSEVEVFKKPTCTEDGVNAIRCTLCGEVKPDTEEKGEKALGHTGGTATCVSKALCERCGQEYGEIAPDNHGTTSIVGKKDATCTENGYTGDKVCDDCEEILEKGKEIAAKGHTPVEIPAIAPTETEAGKTAGKKCSVCGEILEAPTDVPATGKKDSDTKKDTDAKKTEEKKETLSNDFKVTSEDTANPTVEYTGSEDKTAAEVEIPSTVTDPSTNVTYKVTKVADGAFKGNTTVKTITVGENITEIGSNAFSGCTSLNKVNVKSKGITSVGASAFKGDTALTSVDLSGSKIKTIGKNAFSGCKKLKALKLNGNSLKTVGKNSFKNIKKNAKITIYAKNKKTYNKVVKLIKKSGAKKVKYAYKKKK